MRTSHRQRGLTLVEMTLVVATIAVLLGLAIPAVRSLFDAFQSEGSAVSMVSAALSSARATALMNQRYTGVRFQKLCTSKDPANPLGGLIDAPQYMIFVVHEDPARMGGLTIGFRAADGLRPIRLPDTVCVLDPTGIAGDLDIDELPELSSATSFTVLFSPSGKLVPHYVRTRNRDGVYLPSNSDPDVRNNSLDDIFNSPVNIIPDPASGQKGVGRFIQDDYPTLGLFRESSCKGFVVCQAQQLEKSFGQGRAWSGCIAQSTTKPYYVGPYTGELIAPE